MKKYAPLIIVLLVGGAVLFAGGQGNAMANDTTENLTGTWEEVDPTPSQWIPYKIFIDGDKIIITFHDKIICNTIFRREGNELKNTKKRENWQKYAKPNQYEQFGHFKTIKIMDSKLVGFIFEADSGYLKIPFAKRQ